jgi:hypothetical protein
MRRLTITLSDVRLAALREAARVRGKTIDRLIDESLDFYGIKAREEAHAPVRRARSHAKLGEDQALATVLREVRAVRGTRRKV